jgi:putative membrane protein insertion efficiency factor
MPGRTRSGTAAPQYDSARGVGVRVGLLALQFYKSYLSILFAGSCRFEPTCSQFAYEAVERFGLTGGCWLALKRLLRCQPLSRKFGYDPVPENWEMSTDTPAHICHSATAGRREVQT